MLREGILTSGAFAANIDSKKPTLLGMCTTASLWPIVGGLGVVQGYTCQVSKLTQHPASPFWLTSLAGRSADGLLPLAEFLTHPPLPSNDYDSITHWSISDIVSDIPRNRRTLLLL